MRFWCLSLRRGWLACMLGLVLVATACVGPSTITAEPQLRRTQTSDATQTSVATQVPDTTQTLAVTSPPEPTPIPSMDGEDGNLAYVQGGDIWTLALPNGTPQRLTDDGRNSAPLWSPSGGWLAYVKDTALWTVEVGEGPPRLIGDPVNQVAWSPVEDRLAYVIGSGLLRLIVATPDGTEERVLLPSEDASSGQASRIAWSPDGEWIAYEWRQGLEVQGLWKIPADGGQPVALYDSSVPQKGEAVLAGWTADGAHILFWQGPIVSASMLADGVPLYAVAGSRSGSEQGLVHLAGDVLLHHDFVVPGPDALIAIVEGSGRGTWTRKSLAVIDADSEASASLSGPDQVAASPDWSPNGDRIAYVAMPEEGDLVGGEPAREGLMRRTIWMIHAGGDAPRQLTSDPAYRDERPLWAGDGSKLLFVRMNAEGNPSLWWMNVGPAEHGEPTKLVDEIGPIPFPGSPDEAWFGYYGYIEWDRLFDWWRPDSASEPPPEWISESAQPPEADAPDEPATAPDPTATIAAVIAAGEPELLGSTPSPDGHWRADVIAYPCAPVEGGYASRVEQLRLIEVDGDTEIVVETQVLLCTEALGAFGLDVLFWSSDSQTFYFTDAREGVPDGGGGACWKRPLTAFDVPGGRQERLGDMWARSPDGAWLALWQDHQLALRHPGSQSTASIRPLHPSAAVCDIAWTPDGEALVYLEAASPPISPGHAYLVKVDLADLTSSLLLELESVIPLTVVWETPDRITVSFMRDGERREQTVDLPW